MGLVCNIEWQFVSVLIGYESLFEPRMEQFGLQILLYTMDCHESFFYSQGMQRLGLLVHQAKYVAVISLHVLMRLTS
ncbi:hypothetical protein HQN89_21000 [Paenibacillus frigoriresistens]|uniref:hypothetical protein n=1 Tax=Paenibacillus alginolyticus TaxID=59839 RepID=UPI001563AFE9|nr:hypothetical protein [Paenibacillus frigoriresistens]NRF93429.1 hypothetical protein [Paenibacillus frigoriresistens]